MASGNSATSQNATATGHRLGRWLGPGLIALAGLVMFIWSYSAWPDVLVDFGRELYVPWQLSQGKVLYRDVAAFYGPLSPYVNALWFKLFGVSLQTLVMGNLFLLMLFTWLLHRLLRDAAGVWSATVGCIIVMMLFAFGQFIGAGNYNFICPYSHEMTHGVMLGTLVIALLWRHMRTHHRRDLAAAGIVTGIVFLTKLEPFIAVAAATAAGMTAGLWLRRARLADWLKSLGLFLACAMIGPIAACLLLATAMPLDQALRGTVGSWVYLGNAELRRLPFFQVWGGTRDIGSSLGSILMWIAMYGLVLGPALTIGYSLKSSARRRAIWCAAAVAVWVGALAWTVTNPAWYKAFAPLSTFVCAGAIVAMIFLVRHRRDNREQPVDVLRLMLFVFAAALLLKMFLNARIHHYGFALSLPAMLLLIAAMMDWIPGWLEGRGRAGWFFRAACCGVLLIVPVPYLRAMHSWISPKTDLIGAGADEFRIDHGRGAITAAVLEGLAQQAAPGDTMVALPEGIMLNYLGRMPSTSPYLTFLPPDLLMFGEERMLDSLRRNPPTFVLLVHRNTSEYGYEYFGRDYGRSIFTWVMEHYRQIGVVGSMPFQPNHEFGVIVLRRLDTPASAD